MFLSFLLEDIYCLLETLSKKLLPKPKQVKETKIVSSSARILFLTTTLSFKWKTFFVSELSNVTEQKSLPTPFTCEVKIDFKNHPLITSHFVNPFNCRMNRKIPLVIRGFSVRTFPSYHNLFNVLYYFIALLADTLLPENTRAKVSSSPASHMMLEIKVVLFVLNFLNNTDIIFPKLKFVLL